MLKEISGQPGPNYSPGVGAYTSRVVQRYCGVKDGVYLCVACDTKFQYSLGERRMRCPNCRSARPDDLIPIYTEEDPMKSEMLSMKEFHGG